MPEAISGGGQKVNFHCRNVNIFNFLMHFVNLFSYSGLDLQKYRRGVKRSSQIWAGGQICRCFKFSMKTPNKGHFSMKIFPKGFFSKYKGM